MSSFNVYYLCSIQEKVEETDNACVYLKNLKHLNGRLNHEILIQLI